MCKQLTPRHNPPDGTLSLGCTHLHPGIIPLTARSRLAARAADAKICLWQIKHRRVQTAAVGLCRGVYVFIGRVEPILRLEMHHIIHARCYSTARLGIPPRVAYVSSTVMQLHLSQNCILSSTRGTISHIILNYPRAHYNAGLNTSAAVCRRRYLVSVRNLSIRCACNQTRVCRRKGSGRRLPNESVPTEVFRPAASDGRVLAGVYLSIR